MVTTSVTILIVNYCSCHKWLDAKYPTELRQVFMMKPGLGDISRMRVEVSKTVDLHDGGLFKAPGSDESSNRRQFSQFISVYSILLLVEVFGSEMDLKSIWKLLRNPLLRVCGSAAHMHYGYSSLIPGWVPGALQ
jgi:hypothetical protein